MLNTDPQEQFDELKTKLLEQIQQTFPIADRTGRLEVRVRELAVEDDLGTDDIKGQFEARMSGRSWAVPVTGVVEVVEGDKVLVSKRSTIARIPKLTRHYSYIVAGQEKFLTNQWRLRPGVYVRETQKPGEVKAQFQLAKGKPFSIMQESGYLHIKLGSRKVPLYSLLSAQGVTDEQMRKAWGDEIFETSQSKGKNVEKAVRSMYQVWSGSPAGEGRTASELAHEIFSGTKMDAAISAANLGLDQDVVDKNVLMKASTKLLDVSAGKTPPDPIDSLRYKELWTATDHMVHRMSKAHREIAGRVQKALSKPTLVESLRAGKQTALRDVMMPDLIQKPLYHVFVTSLASSGKQTNPLAMLSDRSMTTIRGPGGVTNSNQIKKPNQVLDPSHLGFLDPVFTPEGDPGVTTHLTAGVRIKDRKPYVRMFNVKTGKMEDVDAARAALSNVVLPDQVKWSGGKPKPLKASVRMSDNQGEIRDDIPFTKADYVLPSAAQVFAVETNLVPFMQNDSAGRSSMSARHMAQAISISGREAPLVQVEAGAKRSFEDVVGSTFLATKSPVAGTVTAVVGHKIVVRGADGKEHRVDLYKHYPTNHDKGQLHSTPLVKVGDSVKKDQILADNNYTKDGKLALGTNLRVAYLANGGNHEDGIVISESAAKKLASEHLYKPALFVTQGVHIGKEKFLLHKAGLFSSDRLSKIGKDGFVQPGTIVQPGDPLVLALTDPNVGSQVAKFAERKLGKALRTEFSDGSLVWDGKYAGEVVRVARAGNNVVVHVKTREEVQVGSKLSTRHSAKGIVTQILPDDEMPRDNKSKHVEMLINPVSVPGRMNPGQILETVAGKLAEKTGKPYLVKNFEGGTDYLKKVRDDLKAHGVPETEALFDPSTGRRLGEVTVGPHYVFQLEHQIDKKTHVRPGGRSMPGTDAPKIFYDAETKSPKGGGKSGGQRLGSLGMYGALAAGLKDNLREMQTLKSDEPQAIEVWGAILNGDRIPPPQVPFVYKKFGAMLGGLGVDLQKSGSELRLMPRSDEDTQTMSAGQLTSASRGMRGTNDKEEKGGLFDPDITGGREGKRWSHIELVEPMPNPVFAKAIAVTFGLDTRQPAKSVEQLISGEVKLPGGKWGGRGIREALAALDVDAELAATKKLIDDPKIKAAELDKLNFKYKALKAAKDAGKHPSEIWTMKSVPVLPPIFRPQTTMRDGTIKNNPLNQLYRRLALVNETLERGGGRVPYNRTVDARLGLYQELQNLMGTTPKGKKALDLDFKGTGEDATVDLPGIIHMISGDTPKDGFFQAKMTAKRQDYTARATIVADPNLSADEVGIPKKVALELYRPMVARHLVALHGDPELAQRQISRKDPLAIRMLEKEVASRPVIIKRDPVLHQYGLLGQRVKLTDDPAIKVSPLVLPPLGGDVDGDTVAVFVPIGKDAIKEVESILPSRRPISESSGDVMLTPTNESALALVRMSTPRRDLSGSKSFANRQAAEAAFKSNKINLDDLVIVGGNKTTLGRVRIAEVVPEKYRKNLLTDVKKPFGRREQEALLKEVAKEQPGAFLQTADGLTRLGFQLAYDSGHSVTLKDLEPLHGPRAQIVAAAEKDVAKLRAAGKGDEATERWVEATRQLHDAYTDHYNKAPTNISEMRSAGIKAKKEQFQGLVMAPMLVQDPFGNASKVPITKSFAEGVDLGGYFLQAAGARGGQIDKTQSVREPGYMSKLLVQANIGTTVTGPDCGAKTGLLMPVGERDIVDRYLASSVAFGGHTFQAGAAVTPELLAAARKAGTDKLLVRSPLKCRLPDGVCAKCMGVHPNGRNYDKGEAVGVVAAQALGERAAQLMLKQTHAGGILSTEGKVTDQFGVVDRLFGAAEQSPMDAAVALKTGKVLKIAQWKDGTWAIYLEGERKPYVSRHKPTVRQGQMVNKGDLLTQGEGNLHSILKTKGLDAAQNEMVRRIGDIYAREGVLRRHAEVAVRNATGLVRVKDPGDYPELLRGDYVMKPVIDSLNEGVLRGRRQIVAQSALVATSQIPRYGERDWMARLQGEGLGQSLTRAIQHGERANLHGTNPIPGIAHGRDFGRGPT